MKKIPVVAVVGPTASGKTGLGIAIARRFDGEIVSADSMQIYKGMDIASAKPTAAEREAAPHHLIDFADRQTRFSVAEYVALAGEVIRDIAGRGKLPVVVGGTGLYIDALLSGLTFAEEETDPALRRRLSAEYDRLGGEEMLARLEKSDPEAAARLHPNDRKRILRALEVQMTTGQRKSELDRAAAAGESPYQALYIGLRYCDRALLYDRINRRVDAMLDAGLAAEAEREYDPTSGTAAQAIGHKELAPYFAGEISLDAAAENLKRQTRRYAKRQMTWFSKNEQIHWIDCDGRSVEEIASRAAERIESWRQTL